VTGLLPRTGV